MSNSNRLVLDAKFNYDIHKVRNAFDPAAGGTRGAGFVPVVVDAGQGEVTLHLLAHDLYVMGWTAQNGQTYLLNDASAEVDGAQMVAFGSHYSQLGVDALPARLSRFSILNAVMNLGKVPNMPAANRMAREVGILALVVSESLRNVIVAGLVSQTLRGGKDSELDRDLVLHYARNYGRYSDEGYPDIAVPPGGDGS